MSQNEKNCVHICISMNQISDSKQDLFMLRVNEASNVYFILRFESCSSS